MLDISLPGNSHKSTFETSIPGVLLLRERESQYMFCAPYFSIVQGMVVMRLACSIYWHIEMDISMISSVSLMTLHAPGFEV